MMIRVRSSTISVGGYPLLLCDDLVFEPGRVYCIRGRSGTGKTTFLRTLLGSSSVSTPKKVVEYVQDNDGQELTPLERPELGVHLSVFQQSAPLWPHLSAFSNAWLPWASQSGFRVMFKRREKAKERARYWLNELGLDSSVWQRNPLSLSGGERQRVALAAVLVFDCPCILLDEPTSSLDRTSVNLVSGLLERETSKGKLVIVTSHDVDFLENDSWDHLAIIEHNSQGPQFRLKKVR